ncbi:MAG: head GIN domain-containing protein [Flavobacterium sp.]
MKNIFLIMILAASQFINAQTSKNLGDFNEVKVFDRIVVNLVQSNENKIEIEGTRHAEVEVINKNGELKIRMPFGNLLQGENITATLYYKKIHILNAGEGSVITSSEVITQTALEIISKQGSQVRIKMDVSKAELAVSTGGEIYVSGEAKNVDASINTGGIIEAQKLIASQANVTVKAGGEASIYASDYIKADVTAGGDILIYGSPKNQKKKTTLGGTIKEVN